MDKWHQLSLRRELLFTLQTFICGPKQTLFTMLLEFLTLLIRDEISTTIQVETYFKVKIRVFKRSLAQKNTVCLSFCSLNME